MTYVRLPVFGEFGAWYDVWDAGTRQRVAAWARGRDPSLPADDNAALARIAQSVGQGGGFVAGRSS